MTDRRDVIKQTGLLSMAGIIGANQIAMAEKPNKVYAPTRSKWADGSRLVVSATMLFEAGGQPDNAPSPFPPNMKPGYKDCLQPPGTNTGLKKEYHGCWITGINWASK